MLAEVYAKVGAIPPDDPELHLIDLVEWLSRLPTKTPRRVHLSRELRTRTILSPYEIKGIHRIAKALEFGSNLRQFMGDRTASIRNRRDEKRNPKMRNDLFFSDWGLHHFHLGADLANTKKRVMRTRRVLIAYLSHDDAYLLDVVPHGKGFHDAWGRKVYLEILHNNWPEVLERYELRGILPPRKKDEPLAHEYIQLRESGISPMIAINGKVFMGPGLGVATDGSSTRAVQLADRIRDELHMGEKLFREKCPGVEACLFVRTDASAGFFVPDQNTAFTIFPGRHNEYHVTSFFRRLIDASGLFDKVHDGVIWTPRISGKNK